VFSEQEPALDAAGRLRVLASAGQDRYSPNLAIAEENLSDKLSSTEEADGKFG
jgi:hypothetical protein